MKKMSDWARFLRRRLGDRPDAEHIQSLVRLAIVLAGVVYLYSIDPDTAPGDAGNLLLGRRVVVMSVVVSIGLLLALIANPATSVPRRLLGITHDVVFLSFAMFLGGEGSAPFAALYLLVALGNGFRYGTNYLYFAAVLSIGSFAAVYLSSAYWREQGMLSFNIFMVLTVIPFYVGRLLASLQSAKEQLRRQAAHDSLTGLLNRAEFEATITRLMAADPRGHVLLFCDLDRFKEVNDVAGHAAGDKLLADIAAIISRYVRADDLCGRPGGDEFCVLLKHCSVEKGREIAEQIRGNVAGYRLAWGRDYFSVGVSIGVAPTSAVADVTSLFRLADAACYAAKNAGRNQIHVVDPRVDDLDTGQVRRLFIQHDDYAVVSADTLARKTGARSL